MVGIDLVMRFGIRMGVGIWIGVLVLMMLLLLLLLCFFVLCVLVWMIILAPCEPNSLSVVKK
jgi:hypothetical protein